jgi:hypothetical protein
VEVTAKSEVSKVLVVVKMVEDASLVLDVETVVFAGWEAVVDSEDVLFESRSVTELFDTVVDARIAEKVVELKPLVAAVGVSLEDVSGEFAFVEWIFVGVVRDMKLFVDEISVASVDPWDECAVELFGNASEVGVVETSAVLFVVELVVVVGGVVGMEMAVVDPTDDLMEIVSIVGWFVTDGGVEVPEVSNFLVDVERVEDSSLVLGMETVVVTGWVVVVGSEVALVASISVLELFKTTVDVRISDKIVEVKPSIVAVEVSLEDVSGECFVVEWVFVGVVPDVKLFVVEISVASVVPWEECAVELFGNAVDAGVAEVSIVLVVVERVEHPSVVLSVATVVVPRCVAVVDSGGVLVLVESISVVEFAVSVDFVLPLLATVCV